MNEITIVNSNLAVKEYQGQRVVTFKDVDTVHQRPDGTARKRFNDNKKHFIEGEDYFKICASEIRTHKIMEISSKAHENIVLITESGYLMLVKSFTDDLSWDVQRELVKCYFRTKNETVKTVSAYNYIDKTYHDIPILTVSDVCHLFNIQPMVLYSFIQSRLIINTDYAFLKDISLKDYLNENPDVPRCRNSVYIIYRSGLKRIMDYFNLDIKKVPKFITETRGYVVQEDVRKVMEYVRREIKGVEALTYLVESNDTPSNLERYRQILVRKLSDVSWWKLDVSTIMLGIHNMSNNERLAIHNGKIGMRY